MKDLRDPATLGQALLDVHKVNPDLKLSEVADGKGGRRIYPPACSMNGNDK